MLASCHRQSSFKVLYFCWLICKQVNPSLTKTLFDYIKLSSKNLYSVGCASLCLSSEIMLASCRGQTVLRCRKLVGYHLSPMGAPMSNNPIQLSLNTKYPAYLSYAMYLLIRSFERWVNHTESDGHLFKISHGILRQSLQFLQAEKTIFQHNFCAACWWWLMHSSRHL